MNSQTNRYDERQLIYQFHGHFHPYIEKLMDRFLIQSVSGLQSIDTEKVGESEKLEWCLQNREYFDEAYTLIDEGSSLPLTSNEILIKPPYPIKDLSFDSADAYSIYNWELFFHIPLTIGIHLSKNQRFADAQQWFHYIFDPTDDSDGVTPERFWKVRRFQEIKVYQIQEILLKLAEASYQRDDATGTTSNDADASTADVALIQDVINSIQASIENPFQPHAVARHRQTAYMYKTVMAYLDNLIAWGDFLFRENSRESTNEATQMYMLAANILGTRPQVIPKKYTVKPQTYARLRANLDPFNNAMAELELNLPFVLSQSDKKEQSNQSQSGSSVDGSLSTSQPASVKYIQELSKLNDLGLYFGIPRNEKLLSYWDTVGDRLFKIRNSLNIQGVFRQLPLFEPPIDPALLAKAAAAGVDVGAVASGANQPLPTVRFQLLIQKATEICQEVKSLGSHLLSAIEKEDNEALALLRSQHEQIILNVAEVIKYTQWQEAIKTREASEISLRNTLDQYTFYQLLLGFKENEIKQKIDEKLEAISESDLDGLKFQTTEANIKSDVPKPEIAKGSTTDIYKIALGHKGFSLNWQEFNQLAVFPIVKSFDTTLSAYKLISAALEKLPDVELNTQPTGTGSSNKVAGGDKASKSTDLVAESIRVARDAANFYYEIQGQIAKYARRQEEWQFKSHLAAGEANQIYKQLRAAQLKEHLAKKEYLNHQRAIQNSNEIENFLKGEIGTVGGTDYRKVSTQTFYGWMKREVRSLYNQACQFAFDVAKKAERALQHELGNPELIYIQPHYSNGREDLLAGEKLYLDLKRMEMAYHDQNQRGYELTKHVSLLQVDPVALLKLRATGRCTISLPEELFDMDCPGHYFRRIKSVALTIPCVTGPYTSVNCTLTLQKSSIRKNTLISEGYARTGPEDDRFSDYFGSLQSIVTSSAPKTIADCSRPTSVTSATCPLKAQA
jgi:hypothetical protein